MFNGKTISEVENDPSKRFDIGVELIKRHERSKAIDIFLELNQKYPDDPLAPRDPHLLNVLGVAYHLKGEWEDAKGNLEEAKHCRKTARKYFGKDIGYDPDNSAIWKNFDLIMAIKMMKPAFL